MERGSVSLDGRKRRNILLWRLIARRWVGSFFLQKINSGILTRFSYFLFNNVTFFAEPQSGLTFGMIYSINIVICTVTYIMWQFYLDQKINILSVQSEYESRNRKLFASYTTCSDLDCCEAPCLLITNSYTDDWYSDMETYNAVCADD
jgi:hypothetical protein